MPNEPSSGTPFWAVAISTAFRDWPEHRAAIVQALNAQAMLGRSAKLKGVKDAEDIEAALGMVRESAGFVGFVGKTYGWVPKHPDRNPTKVSLAELEMDQALAAGIPSVMFVMSDRHVVTKKDVERNPKRLIQLDAFRQRVIGRGNGVMFNDLESLKRLAERVFVELRELIEKTPDQAATPNPSTPAALPQLPGAAWRAEFAYRVTLNEPARYELLETLDVGSLREALYAAGGEPPIDPEEVLSRLRGASAGAEPNALWAAWVETVHAAKLRQS